MQEVNLTTVTEGVISMVTSRLKPMLEDLRKSIITAKNRLQRPQAIKVMESTCKMINKGVKTYAQMVQGGMATAAHAFGIGGLLPVPQIIDDVCMQMRMVNQACQLLMD